ncbi:MAG: hypothetical protein IT436_15160 [Phycisphaerales bacterium]|nr:hypothetical protein [Phycisphaerales bacterium]
MILAAGPLAPPWAVFPMALVTMIVIASHLSSLARADMPASRRRIRKANGWLMMFLVIALACAFGLSSSPRMFVMLWMMVAGLTGLVLILAWMDAVNSLRLHRRDRVLLQRHMRSLVAARIPSADDRNSGRPQRPDEEPGADDQPAR